MPPTADPPVTAMLTDLYPNHEAFERVAKENPAIDAIHEPVDATAVPERLTGLRTLFSGFHHFRPAQARLILRDAVDSGWSGPCVIEPHLTHSDAVVATNVHARARPIRFCLGRGVGIGVLSCEATRSQRSYRAAPWRAAPYC